MSPTLKSTWGWVTLGPNLGVFPLEQTRHVGVAKSERHRLTNGGIIFEEFQPMWSQFTNVTDRQADRQTTCDRNTALCTKVHRAVKSIDRWGLASGERMLTDTLLIVLKQYRSVSDRHTDRHLRQHSPCCVWYRSVMSLNDMTSKGNLSQCKPKLPLRGTLSRQMLHCIQIRRSLF